MNIKATMGICRETIKCKDKLVVIPKDPEEFRNNELVLIVSAKDFLNFSQEADGLIKFIKGIKEMEINDEK